ncbi:MAG: hypothetical protein VXZ72_02765, partial [Chlamydiota bacterium]|nr:hypothetical protein [Chlamydiota bacterium]
MAPPQIVVSHSLEVLIGTLRKRLDSSPSPFSPQTLLVSRGNLSMDLMQSLVRRGGALHNVSIQSLWRGITSFVQKPNGQSVHFPDHASLSLYWRAQLIKEEGHSSLSEEALNALASIRAGETLSEGTFSLPSLWDPVDSLESLPITLFPPSLHLFQLNEFPYPLLRFFHRLAAGGSEVTLYHLAPVNKEWLIDTP